MTNSEEVLMGILWSSERPQTSVELVKTLAFRKNLSSLQSQKICVCINVYGKKGCV